MEQWGSTLCELPKVKAKNMSYRELCDEARSVPDTMTYLVRFVMNHNGPSPKVRDFRSYTEFIQFPTATDRTSYLGTSTVIRRFKK